MTKRRDFSAKRNRCDLLVKVEQEIFYLMEDFTEHLKKHMSYSRRTAASRVVDIPDFEAKKFQYYLETWSGLSVIDDENLEEVLAIANFYDDKSVLDKCKEWDGFTCEPILKIERFFFDFFVF